MASGRLFLNFSLFRMNSLLPMDTSNVLLNFGAKLKLESRNQKVQYVAQVATFKLTSLKMNRILPIDTKQ